MKLNTLWLFLLLVICGLFHNLLCVEPISMGIAAGAAAVAGIGAGYCFVKECCTQRWTNHSAHELGSQLSKQLIGQHLVLRIAAKTILAHVKKTTPEKALVLSFHGWTGSGKNFVADMIANAVYKKGTSSHFFHKYITGNDFPHHEKLQSYKDRLKKEIVDHTYACERSMFVFDEVEKMPEGLLDVLKPYVDHYEHIKNIDYRKNIYIFLSNIGGDQINKFVFNHFHKGLKRESITMREMEKILSIGAFNIKGGFKNANLVLANLIDFYIPFLPMEMEHVKACVRADINKRGAQLNHEEEKEIVNNVANDMEYFPKQSPVFSKSGCKKVTKKLDSYL